MAPDDRDRTFEKALARQLRSSASSTPEASSPAGASGGPLAELCPDPETLAAYHDGSLSLEERNLWKNHVLSCDSCQLVLAHLATPLDIPVGLDVKENVLVAQQRAASAAASPAPAARPSPIHSLRWLWLVPAGAIAAALVAWVSLQERKPLSVTPSSPVEIAENRQAATVASSPKPALSDSMERKRKDQSAASSTAGAREADSVSRDSALKNSQNEVQQNQQTISNNAPAPTHGPSVSQQKQEQQINRIAAGRAGAADQKKLDATSNLTANGRNTGAAAGSALASPTPVPAGDFQAGVGVGVAKAKRADAPLTPPPPPPSSEPGFVAGGSIPASPPAKAAPAQHAPAPSPASGSGAGAAPKPEAVAADSISAATESVEVSSAPQAFAKTKAQAQERGMMRAAALQNPRIFGTPDGKQLWRIGPAGSLEHSKDEGVNWIQQISGVYTDLRAGSAPSAKVCWIVGNAGTILRTTDGGTHWTKLDSPVTNDLTGVRAEDAKHAWIWFVPDQQAGLVKTYQTSDGGRTWSTLTGE
jgi:hypothetical protein